jgi:5-methyltetrahydrofolate--homocysteine methyltransferase
MKTIQQMAAERVLLLDGATGTMVQQYGVATGNNDLLSLTHPEIVEDIHNRYLRAGADIIETCTFNAQRISMAETGDAERVRDINLAAAAIARRCADAFTTPDHPRFVAGSVGPTGKTLSMSPDIADPAFRALTFDEMYDAYLEQMTALLEGGVDALLIETVFDTLNAKAALMAAETAMQQSGYTVPLMLSVTVSDKAGRTLSGQTLEAMLTSVSHVNLLSIGLNCSFGAEDIKPFLRRLAEEAPCLVSCYPNAGLPNALGAYDTPPDEWATVMKSFVDEGLANIVGGCCGTTDDYIASLHRMLHADGSVSLHTVRAPKAPDEALCLSGLERLRIYNKEVAVDGSRFVGIGERCNVAGSRKFLRFISEKNYAEAVAIARRQVEDGAQMLDINMDDGLLNAVSEMTHFLRLLASEPDVARVPFMIDSSDWNVITAALRCVQGKCVVNSISLKEGEEVFLAHARELRRCGAAVVVMAFDEQGQADTCARKTAVCKRAYHLLVEKADMNPADIIFDPNVLAVATGIEAHDRYALDFIEATRWIREHLPGCHVSGGISNLSFAFRGNNPLREAMHAVFLYHAMQNGLGMAIINPASVVQYADIPVHELELLEDVVLCRRPDATARLLEAVAAGEAFAADDRTAPTHTSIPTAEESVDERLAHALVAGDAAALPALLTEALTHYTNPVDIIEGPLMQGMNIVGDRFGEGKMFLPQVVKTARTMKEAVALLQPDINARRPPAADCECCECGIQVHRHHALLATVKGDVHDIGKNIVAIVMACNGFEVTDMGVMVPAEEIVAKARELQPDIIGLSGLITPSLSEMVTVCAALREAGLHIPVMIGGATTSEMHTALRIAPVSDAPVVYVRDASQNSSVAARMLDPATRDAFVKELHHRQQQLRDEFARREASRQLLSLKEARARRTRLF